MQLVKNFFYGSNHKGFTAIGRSIIQRKICKKEYGIPNPLGIHRWRQIRKIPGGIVIKNKKFYNALFYSDVETSLS